MQQIWVFRIINHTERFTNNVESVLTSLHEVRIFKSFLPLYLLQALRNAAADSLLYVYTRSDLWGLAWADMRGMKPLSKDHRMSVLLASGTSLSHAFLWLLKLKMCSKPWSSVKIVSMTVLVWTWKPNARPTCSSHYSLGAHLGLSMVRLRLKKREENAWVNN